MMNGQKNGDMRKVKIPRGWLLDTKPVAVPTLFQIRVWWCLENKMCRLKTLYCVTRKFIDIMLLIY